MGRKRGPTGGHGQPVWGMGGYMDPSALESVRDGGTVCGWANEITPGAALVVLTPATAPGLVFNLVPGNRVMIVQYCYAVETASDNCQFEFGWCEGADGTGVFHPVGPHKHVYTGASNQGRTAFDQDIGPPPAVISYAAGARSLTFRVDANDASCEITVGYHGWVEDEG